MLGEVVVFTFGGSATYVTGYLVGKVQGAEQEYQRQHSENLKKAEREGEAYWEGRFKHHYTNPQGQDVRELHGHPGHHCSDACYDRKGK